ncbi:MAG TPA: hypothetical protein VFY21_15570 [Xanthobacteraceae bacterium]|nr:hypothetical protein [Xanthobacteraceae bacterium]
MTASRARISCMGRERENGRMIREGSIREDLAEPFFDFPLPFFITLTNSLIAGLDPAIQDNLRLRPCLLDARVEPGHEGE